MKTEVFDVVVIGGGAAGIAAALGVARHGFRVALVEREEVLGGILLQCIHNGFGLHRFKEELTGPEYAERALEEVEAMENIKVFLETTVVEIKDEDGEKTIVTYSSQSNVMMLTARAVIFATGCRERNRGNIGIPGGRPAGVFTAGLAQRLVNIDGYVPGKEAVIVGSGDIGLIMARRLSWVGMKVKAVVEIMPYPSGLTRNIVQCLYDYDIPLYLSHAITKIHGGDRVDRVTISPLVDGTPDTDNSFDVDCDTLLFSVGLIPEVELMKNVGVEINHDTAGPFVDNDLMTNVPGIFACGNVLHVHDLVDFVSEESERCGRYVFEYLERNAVREGQGEVRPGANLKYVVPNRFRPGEDNQFYSRSMIVKNDAVLRVTAGERTIKTKKLRHVQPSEMISIQLTGEELAGVDVEAEQLEIEVS
jgi:thioredoxin reductase